jgi:nucleotide-binding universal stress UspA family protein
MKKILVAIDFSASSAEVIRTAAELAKGLGASVSIIHVTPDRLTEAYRSMMVYDFTSEYVGIPQGDVEMARDICAKEYREEHQHLSKISGQLRSEGLDVQAMLLKGDAADILVKKATVLKADLVIMGSHGHSLVRKMLLGSVSEAVLKAAPCGVLIVPSKKGAVL